MPSTLGQLKPAESVFDITANGSTFEPTRAITVNADGNANLTFRDGTTATVNLKAGAVYPFSITSVAASGTTATGIKGYR